MKYEFRSAVPCLVKYDGGEEFLEDGQSLVFDKPEKMFVYPAAKGYASFVLDCNSSSCPIKKFELTNRVLYFFSSDSPSQIRVKETLNVGDNEVKFVIGQNFVEIEHENSIRKVESIPPKTYELFSREKIAVLKIKGNEQQQLITFSTASSAVLSLTYDKIEVVENEIFCEKFGKEEKYIFSDGSIVKIRSANVQTKNSKILGMLFLQKVKEKQYKDAGTMLSTYLSSSEEKIAAYFGEIENILPLSENTFLLDKKTGPLVVRLDLQNDKIINIELVD